MSLIQQDFFDTAEYNHDQNGFLSLQEAFISFPASRPNRKQEMSYFFILTGCLSPTGMQPDG